MTQYFYRWFHLFLWSSTNRNIFRHLKLEIALAIHIQMTSHQRTWCSMYHIPWVPYITWYWSPIIKFKRSIASLGPIYTIYQMDLLLFTKTTTYGGILSRRKYPFEPRHPLESYTVCYARLSHISYRLLMWNQGIFCLQNIDWRFSYRFQYIERKDKYINLK